MISTDIYTQLSIFVSHPSHRDAILSYHNHNQAIALWGTADFVLLIAKLQNNRKFSFVPRLNLVARKKKSPLVRLESDCVICVSKFKILIVLWEFLISLFQGLFCTVLITNTAFPSELPEENKKAKKKKKLG